MAKILVTEKQNQATEIAFLVDDKTGEIIPVYDHQTKKMEPYYKRNSRRLTTQRNQEEKLLTWLNSRGLKGVEDAQSEKDIEAIIGEHSYYESVVHQQGIMLLTRAGLSKAAMNLAIRLIQHKLVGKNYCILSNKELAGAAGDRSGNYGRYLNELQDINFCKVRNISKLSKLITVNPIYGYRGYLSYNNGSYQRALDRYYPCLKGEESMALLRQLDENEWLEAA